jgi:hypothetical protein
MKKCIVCYLVLAMAMIGAVPPVNASFLPTEALVRAHDTRTQDLEKVQAVLETKLVQQRLADHGFSAQEIQSRITQLTDEQIHQLAQGLDELRIGQGGAGVVIGVLVIIGLVVLIYYLLTNRIVIQ